jgi:hypothetical protein
MREHAAADYSHVLGQKVILPDFADNLNVD